MAGERIQRRLRPVLECRTGARGMESSQRSAAQEAARRGSRNANMICETNENG